MIFGRTLAVAACGALLLTGTVVTAQPTLKRRPPSRSQRSGPPAIKRPASDNACPQRRRVLTEEESRLDSYQADYSGVEAEISELERRLSELKARRSSLKGIVAQQQRRVKGFEVSYKKQCEAAQDCNNYTSLAENLERQSEPLESDLQKVKDEIGGTQRDLARLQKQIGPLQQEYASKSCGDLVPGETAQSTIDRCSAIFSEWNRLQAELNRANNQLSELRRRYQVLLSQLEGLERRANEYETYLAQNCKSQTKHVTRLRGYKGVRERAASLGRELDTLVDAVTKLRGVRITVSPK